MRRQRSWLSPVDLISMHEPLDARELECDFFARIWHPAFIAK
jgi:hypothetical protein